jgi:ATP-dependent Zn protease
LHDSSVDQAEADDERATAFHEAGHAVLAITLGRPVEKVTIERNSMRLGQVQMSKRRGLPIKDTLEAQALILLAGVVAEARIVGRYNWPGAQQDMIGVRQLARYRGATDKQVERLQQRWLDKTEHLVDDPDTWLAIERVAEELVSKKSLSGRAVQHIVDRTIDHD